MLIKNNRKNKTKLIAGKIESYIMISRYFTWLNKKQPGLLIRFFLRTLIVKKTFSSLIYRIFMFQILFYKKYL